MDPRVPQDFIDEVVEHAPEIAKDLYLYGVAGLKKRSADQKLEPIDACKLVIAGHRTPPVLAGWVCPVCDKGVSPFLQLCPCTRAGRIFNVAPEVIGEQKVPFHVCQPDTTAGCNVCGKKGDFVV